MAVSVTPAAAQQQGSIQLSTESQIIQGNQARRGGERTIEPDFGVLWLQPGTRFGQFLLEARGTRRGNELHLGRTSVAVRDAKARGVTWTLEAGDLYASPAPGDYQFSNLSAPSFTFSGGSLTAKTPRTTLQVVGGRTTALRNIFGTDPQALGQTVGLARATLRPNTRLQINARAAHTRTSNLREFSRLIDASDQAGGGARVTVTPWLHLVADGSYVRYRATGASDSVRDYSYLVGTHVLLSRGWVQVDATRFSPGDLPVLNASLQDRKGLFAAAEYDVFSRLRLFGGWETLDTNIRPAGTSLLRPAGTIDRGYGGVRLRVGERSSFSLRVEQGDRLSRPVVPGLVASLAPTTSDTGAVSAEWQTNVRKLTAFGRYSRRENVDLSNTVGTFTQHDSSGQVFLNLSRSTQLFTVATLTHQSRLAGGGSTYLQLSGGGQQRIFTPGLWFRIEGSASRNRDLLSGVLFPRNALSVGLNGQLTPQTTVGVNVYVDRAPIGFVAGDGGWLTRSTVRIVHSIPMGSVRVANGASPSAIGRGSRGTGSVLGSVFADWNANGQPDAGEEVLAGIPVQLGTISHVTTARDGQFAFLNVPAGAQHVGLDLNALPVDFDPPSVTDILVELSRGDTRRVAFGLVPLGAVYGKVIEDVNKNGQLDPGEPPVPNAVLTLDGGQRSELAKKGSFRFDAIRAGEHRLELLQESLPEGAVIVGDRQRPLAITRDHTQVEMIYLVRLEKRPEVRKVFPPKIGSNAPGKGTDRAVGVARNDRTDLKAGKDRTDHTDPRAGKDRTDHTDLKAGKDGPITSERVLSHSANFTIQIAALNDPLRARGIVADLKAAGFAAYLVAPPASAPDDPYRIRVGRYTSRVAAQQTVTQLEKKLGEKLWVTRARR